MKTIKKSFCLLLSLALCAVMLVPAASAEDGFNASLTIVRTETQITVTVVDSTVLQTEKPTLSIPCDFSEAHVTHNGDTVGSELKDGNISFTVASGGDYIIIRGTAPGGDDPGDDNPGDDTPGSDTPGTPTPTPSTPSVPTPTPTTDESGNTAVEINSAVSSGELSATVDDYTANRLVSQAVSSESKNVTVEAKPSWDSQVKEATVELPASAVADLAEKTDASLTVKTPVGSVTIPNETLASLSESARKIAVTVAVQTDEETSASSYEIAVLRDGEAADTAPGLNVSLPVSESETKAGNTLVAVLVDAEGKETILPKSALTGESEFSLALDVGSATVKLVDNTVTYADKVPVWAEDAVQFMSSRNLFVGVGKHRFAANATMDRAMLVTVLHRLEGKPKAGAVSFVDVTVGSWYAKAAAWAAESELVTDTSAGFGPAQPVTRQDMALILYRYMDKFGQGEGTKADFSAMDGAADVAEDAREAMSWAVGSGIIGDESGVLNPTEPLTRGEVSVMLARLVELLVKK